MALRPLVPAVTESLGNGWDIVASEGGRSNKGLQGSVTLFNGTPQACRILAMGNATEQRTVATEFASLAGLDIAVVTHALVKLAVAVEGVLRQIEMKFPSTRSRQ